eukprot:3962587-Prymnesium_polylepis.1
MRVHTCTYDTSGGLVHTRPAGNEAPNPGDGADESDEHSDGHEGGAADGDGDMDANDEDDDEYDTGMADEHAGGAAPSPA